MMRLQESNPVVNCFLNRLDVFLAMCGLPPAIINDVSYFLKDKYVKL